jgi:hypothetical protein
VAVRVAAVASARVAAAAVVAAGAGKHPFVARERPASAGLSFGDCPLWFRDG